MAKTKQLEPVPVKNDSEVQDSTSLDNIISNIQTKQECGKELAELRETVVALNQAKANLTLATEKMDRATLKLEEATKTCKDAEGAADRIKSILDNAIEGFGKKTVHVAIEDKSMKLLVAANDSLMDKERTLIKDHETKILRIISAHTQQIRSMLRDGEGEYLSCKEFTVMFLTGMISFIIVILEVVITIIKWLDAVL